MKIDVKQIPEDVRHISEIFTQASYEIFIVGGCVRDILMEREPHDWDMCTNATPDEMLELCKKHDMHYILTGLKHGTITINLNGENYEITTYRVDGDYSDGRHPDNVTFTTSLYEDLSRRDFTINAMAVNPLDGTLIDPFGGVIAIANKKLIAVGNAGERLNEDALRIIRAIRFAIKYELEIDCHLKDAMLARAQLLNIVSKERITDEFRKIFTTGKPVSDIFKEFRIIIGVIIPEIKNCFDFKQNNRYHKHDVYEHILAVVDNCESSKFEIKMAALFHDIGKPDSYVEDKEGNGHFYGHPDVSTKITESILNKDFRVSVEERAEILMLVKYHDMYLAETKKSVRRALNKLGIDVFKDWLILKQADMDDHIYPDDKYIKTTSNYVTIMNDIIASNSAFSIKDLDINGHEIMSALNIKPGKIIGIILNKILDEVIDETLENEKVKLVQRSKEIFEEMSN